MIKLKVNHEGKLTNEVRSSGLQQGEQFFRTIQITTPKFIQGVNITGYEVKMILKLKGEKYIYNLQLQKEKNGTLKYSYDVFSGLTESVGEFEICLMWVYGKNQYISNILKITVNNTLLSGEIKDINEYLDEYKLEIDKVMSVSRQLEEKDKYREINEEARSVAEKSRGLTFETWNTKFKEFIDNDSKHQINENQRIITINQITKEWEELKNQLSESDIQNIDRKINEIKNTISNHVKTLKVNETNNTIEAYLEKDTTVPTFKLGLPRGFSGSYNDLIDKPVTSSYQGPTYSMHRFGDIVILTVNSGTNISTIGTYVFPIVYRPSANRYGSASYHNTATSLAIYNFEITTAGKINIDFTTVENAGTQTNRTSGQIWRNLTITYSI